MIFNYVFVYT